jgi:hypothetical protein
MKKLGLRVVNELLKVTNLKYGELAFALGPDSKLMLFVPPKGIIIQVHKPKIVTEPLAGVLGCRTVPREPPWIGKAILPLIGQCHQEYQLVSALGREQGYHGKCSRKEKGRKGVGGGQGPYRAGRAEQNSAVS